MGKKLSSLDKDLRMIEFVSCGVGVAMSGYTAIVFNSRPDMSDMVRKKKGFY